MDTMDNFCHLNGILWTLYYCMDTMDKLHSDSKSQLRRPQVTQNKHHFGIIDIECTRYYRRRIAKSLEEQDVEVAYINWSPPAGGDEEMIDLLDKLL